MHQTRFGSQNSRVGPTKRPILHKCINNNANIYTRRQHEHKSNCRKKKSPELVIKDGESCKVSPAAKLVYYRLNSESSLSATTTHTFSNKSTSSSDIRDQLTDDDVQDIVNLLLSDDSNDQSERQSSSDDSNKNKVQGTVIYKKLHSETAEIGVVDISLPARKQMAFVTNWLDVKMPDLQRYCQLFNRPEHIVDKHLHRLNKLLLRFSSLKSNIFHKIVTTLERNGLLTTAGVANIFQLMSHKKLATGPLLKTSVKTVYSTSNLSKFLRRPFNLISTTKLSNLLERLRLDRPLSNAEGEKLTAYVFALLKLSPTTLTSFLKMLVGNNLVTHAQMQKFLRILTDQKRNGHTFDGILLKFRNISAINAKDLSNLLNRWPHVESTFQMKRLRKYLKILNTIDSNSRFIFLSAMREYGYLDRIKLELLIKFLAESKKYSK